MAAIKSSLDEHDLIGLLFLPPQSRLPILSKSHSIGVLSLWHIGFGFVVALCPSRLEAFQWQRL